MGYYDSHDSYRGFYGLLLWLTFYTFLYKNLYIYTRRKNSCDIMAVKDVSEKDFETEVLKSATPVLVDVWATWCGPCRMYSPIVDEVSEDYKGKLKFVKVDADENESIASKYGIMSIPTTLLIENGKVKAQSVGAVPKEVLKKWIDKNL